MPSKSQKILSIEELKEVIRPVAEKYGVERIYLFGSIAKGTNTEESDYDFCIEKGKVRDYFEFSAFYNAIEKAVGTEVDIITTKTNNTEFLNKIKEEWVLVYGE
ncbi:MAG: nucleotidyltransferase domain-containing protein [Methanomassiliicoccaceae archaeon]|nr:nucleotidyltransferase domain-containing protein [Methanomassiliicoccaceae archaeon]